ncbi:hypothetical protein T09_4377 [Trichinella sp. T9]|nr:hypothetical protein T09_4377 [Trichinella sp. T9]
MNSTAVPKVSDRIHLDGSRHEPLSLLRLPLWFLSSHFPCQALDSTGKQVQQSCTNDLRASKVSGDSFLFIIGRRAWKPLKFAPTSFPRALNSRKWRLKSSWSLVSSAAPSSVRSGSVVKWYLAFAKQWYPESSSKPRKLRLSFVDAWKLSLLESLFAYTLVCTVACSIISSEMNGVHIQLVAGWFQLS